VPVLRDDRDERQSRIDEKIREIKGPASVPHRRRPASTPHRSRCGSTEAGSPQTGAL